MIDGLRYIWNIEASFMARPMSPLTFSLPDMKSICPDCLPESMSSQSCDEIWSVRFGLVPAPGFTTQVPSLMTAFQVPPPSPLTSYWITAFVPLDLSARKRPAIASNVSFTVGIAHSFSDWRRGAFAGRRSPTLGRQNVKRSIPPVTVSTAPVMYRARSEHRNATAFATSSGSPSRCIATRLTIRSYSGLSLALGAMIPGAIALHVTLYRAPSRATDFAKPIRPILLVEYAV